MTATPGTAAQAIEAADDERIRALVAGDVDALERMHGDELVYVHSSAFTEGKDSYLKGLRAGRVKFLGISRERTSVRAWGDVALLHCKARLDFEMGGETRTANSNVVSAWVRREGRWQMVHYHSTSIPPKST